MTQSVRDRTPRRLRPAASWRRWYLAGLTALTAYSTALGWQAQQVSYPLYRAVGAAEFPAYHLQYNQAIPLVVVIPGFVGFLAAAGFYRARPPELPRTVAALISVTGVVALASTVFWAIPMHDRLDAQGQSAATIDSLLQANLVRTLALTAGSLALVWSVVRSGRSGPA